MAERSATNSLRRWISRIGADSYVRHVLSHPDPRPRNHIFRTAATLRVMAPMSPWIDTPSLKLVCRDRLTLDLSLVHAVVDSSGAHGACSSPYTVFEPRSSNPGLDLATGLLACVVARDVYAQDGATVSWYKRAWESPSRVMSSHHRQLRLEKTTLYKHDFLHCQDGPHCGCCGCSRHGC